MEMRDVKKISIEQLDKAVEEFSIGRADELVEAMGDKLGDGYQEYRVYKNHPFKSFNIQVREVNGKFYLRHIENNGYDEYKGKNIVFAALCHIADYLQVPIYSSAKHPGDRIDELDRLNPDTMGKRWGKMLIRNPERVRDLGERFVLMPIEMQNT